MTRINKHFFEMAQSSAKEAVSITSNRGGVFDWDVAMVFLRMAYYRESVECYEAYFAQIEKVNND